MLNPFWLLMWVEWMSIILMMVSLLQKVVAWALAAMVLPMAYYVSKDVASDPVLIYYWLLSVIIVMATVAFLNEVPPRQVGTWALVAILHPMAYYAHVELTRHVIGRA